MTPHHRSVLMLLLTMIIWGSTFVVTKGINEQIPPFTLAFARVAIGALILMPFLLLRPARAATEPAASNRALPWGTISLMGLIGVALYYAVFNWSLMLTSASQGALVQSCIPAMTALIAVMWLRERATVTRWLGIGLTIAGVLIVFSGSGGGDGAGSVFGNVLMFVTTILWGIYTSLAKRVADVDPRVVTAGIATIGAALLLPMAIVEIAAEGMPRVGATGWLGIVYLGTTASGLAYLLYNAALKHMDASHVGVYTNLIPIVGVLSGVIVLGEPLSLRAVVGGCVVLAGVWITGKEGRRSG
ncbi:MAG: DMT family transporter [Steroidobacteraceae bacterium]